MCPGQVEEFDAVQQVLARLFDDQPVDVAVDVAGGVGVAAGGEFAER